MSWIDRIFNRGSKPPVAPAPAAPAAPVPGPPPAPQDTVTVGSSPSTPPTIPAAPVPDGKAEAQEQEKRLRERLHVLESVGRGVSGDYRMQLEAGDAWAYDFGSNTITYKKDDLRGKSEDYAVGVILQETGRRTYSRKPTAPEFKDNAALDFLNNAVEGPRVNNLQTSKFGGAKQFFQAVYDEDLLNKTEDSIREELEKQLVATAGLSPEEAKKTALKMKSPVPRHMQYALGLIHDWYTDGKGDSPDWMRDKNAMRALAATQADYRRAYELKREIFEKDLSPKEIIEQSAAAEKIVVEKLWPVYKKLLEMDQKDLGQSLFGNKPSQGAGQGQPSQGAGQGQPSQGAGQGQPSQGAGQGQPSQGAGQGQPSQGAGQGQPSQGAGQGQPSQGAEQGQPSQGAGQGQSQGAEQGQPSQGAGQGQPAQGAEQGQPSQGAGQGQQAEGKGQSQGAEQGQAAGQNGPANGNGQGNVPDPRDLIDGTDGGTLDDSHLTNEQREMARQVLQKLAGKMREKIESRQERDQRAGGEGAQGAGNNLGGGQYGPHQNNEKGQGGPGGQGPPGGGYSNAPIDLPGLQKLLEQKAETERLLENIKSPYEKYYTVLAPYADEFSGELRNILKENSDMKFVGDFGSGKKLNMRRAMQSSAKFERTGQYDDEIWLRRNDPTQRTYDFVFVLDESGSMLYEERWDNLLKAMVMSAEALEQLKINFAVIGYSDDPVIHKSFKDKYDERFREQMLVGIQQAPHANNNEHDALHACMQMLEERPSENQKIVIFITDGLTEASQVTDGLKRAEELGAKMIGVGIGPAMAEVKGLFPESLVAERVQALPFLLADEIRRQIVEGLEDSRLRR